MSSDFERINRMISLESLVKEIIKLEKEGVILFDDFENLDYKEIQDKYFLMPNPTQVAKAKIKVRDIKNGHEGLSSFTTRTLTNRNGSPSIETKTEYF